jgi:glycosyltransferase involved in cell wall biosynthesis
MELKSPNYVVITPARNEAAGIEDTILRMAAQTVRPSQWVIVNDGSTDATGSIIDEYARKYSWITAVHRTDRGYRSPGGGVIDAVLEGFRHLRSSAWEFIVKFDADMSPGPDYFELCLSVFEREPQLGVGGGTVYHLAEGEPVVEPNPAFHVRGATKIYRRACWDALGGLLAAPGWDTLDEVKANMLGWQTRTYPDIRVLQRRPTGSNDGAWRDCVKNGRADYICGYHPVFMLLKSAKRFFQKPYITGSLGHLWGFVSAYLEGISRVDDPVLIAYLRQQQVRRIFGMKTIWT